METKNIHKHAGWFASYMDAADGWSNPQGEALIECQILKIKQLQSLLSDILGEVSLKGEVDSDLILDSIEELILQEGRTEVEYTKGYYKWTG